MEMLAAPKQEFPQFPAALSHVLLALEEIVRALDDRLVRVRATLEQLEAGLARGAGIGLPRITLLETKYLRATTRAEADWLGAVLDDLRAGRLVWSTE
ncbi:hypothetical protein ACWC9T_13805 [Kitasatospora sp. NPDC001159]